MQNVHPTAFETNQPRSCRGNTGLNDRAELEAWQDAEQIRDERFDEAFFGTAPVVRPTPKLTRQQISDLDSDFLDMVGAARLNAIIDAAYTGNASVALMLMQLQDERAEYRRQFASSVA